MTSAHVDPASVPRRPRATLAAIATALAALALLLRWPFLQGPGFAPDQTQFVQWSIIARDGGIAALYVPGKDQGPLCNYPPLYPLVLRGMAGLADRLAPRGTQLNHELLRRIAAAESTPETRWVTTFYKLPATLADAVLAAIVFICLARGAGLARAALTAGVLAIAPALIHNSAVWGQMDSIVALLIVLSLEAALRGRMTGMLVWAALALLTKAQAVAFVPLWLCVLWAHRDRPASEWRRAALTCIAVSVLVLLPVSTQLPGVWEAYAGAAGRYPYTHLNAFSGWFVADPLNAPHLTEDLSRWYVRDDLPRALGLSARAWGLAGVMGAWCLVALDLLRSRARPASIRRAAAILPLAFFFFSTQMHERYLLLAVVTWAWSGPGGWRGWTAWITLALVASINACWVWPGPSTAWWTETCAAALNREWFGRACGYWCGLALAVLFAVAISSRRTWAAPSQQAGAR